MLQDDEDNFIYVEIHTHKIMNKAQSKQKQMWVVAMATQTMKRETNAYCYP